MSPQKILTDSGAALEALGSRRFDVALVDIIMPGVGGLEVLTTAREQGCATPIVVITAASTMNNAIEALKRGARDYLTKPFENLDLVVTTAARAAETAAQASELERVKEELDRKLGAARSSGIARPSRKSTSSSDGWSATTRSTWSW